MNLAILSRSVDCYSTSRLVDAAKARGHEVTVFDTLKFSMDLECGEPDLYYHNIPIESCDAVLPRIGASVTYFCLLYTSPSPRDQRGSRMPSSA